MMKLAIIIFVALWAIIYAEQLRIPVELKPLQETILNRIVTPEDGTFERDVKSLFAQYLLLTAMEAAAKNESSPEAVEAEMTKEQLLDGEVPLPMRAEVVARPTYPPAPAQPQIIYVYVTAPPTVTEATRAEASNIKTKKPPKTKKPKPPRHQHPWHQEQQTSAPVVQQQASQPVYVIQQQTPAPQPIYVIQQQTPPPQIQQQPEDQPQQSIIAQEEPASEPRPTSATQPPPQIVVIQQQPTPAPTSVPILVPAATSASATAAPVTAAPVPVTLRPTPSPEHVLNQVDQILINVAKGNITGIVDQSLAIRTPMPVRNLVNGILNTIFCNPINRLLGRCRG